ncbi:MULTISPECIES: nucleotide exchange factor GrpE [unclassified Chelatococcus]|uniref:nucleotide exchange factor GrpE n=1 Tax=unclassified Chelatococcus TaxID=2638111 RepID=UPI000308D4E8|nr:MULTISPECIES: nucleotide exchange factor GrpE [unclassified Chelatococcus]ALA17144.1 heat -hock protein GrpE [Chelatococcus sp. CO-6]
MTQKPTRPEPVDETLAAADAPENAAPEAEQAASEALEALVSERDDLKDKLLRTLAEMENLRRRTEREVADARAYGMTSFARDMLTVADNIQRALESVPPEVRGSEAAKPFVEGVELTERDLLKTLERHGVRKLSPQGERFDPNLHQAMFEVPDPSVPNGTVVQVVQAGFVIGERVLRPALVGVSKGGPKPGNGDNGAGETKLQ